MGKIEAEKARLRRKMDRIARRIEKIQRRRERRSSNKPVPLVMPDWDSLAPATFPVTKGAINVLLQYPNLDGWVKQLVEEAAEDFLKTRDAEVMLEQMRKVRDRIMSSITAVCRRRRSVFRNSREYQWVKISNRRAVAVRFKISAAYQEDLKEFEETKKRLRRAERKIRDLNVELQHYAELVYSYESRMEMDTQPPGYFASSPSYSPESPPEAGHGQ